MWGSRYFSSACMSLKGLAPRAGLEPATFRLTAERSTIELPGSRLFFQSLAAMPNYHTLQCSGKCSGWLSFWHLPRMGTRIAHWLCGWDAQPWVAHREVPSLEFLSRQSKQYSALALGQLLLPLLAGTEIGFRHWGVGAVVYIRLPGRVLRILNFWHKAV
jgi:hypothetical protein